MFMPDRQSYSTRARKYISDFLEDLNYLCAFMRLLMKISADKAGLLEIPHIMPLFTAASTGCARSGWCLK